MFGKKKAILTKQFYGLLLRRILMGILKENLSKFLNDFIMYEPTCMLWTVLCRVRRHSNLTMNGMCPSISLLGGDTAQPVHHSLSLVPPSYGHVRDNQDGRISGLWQCNSFSLLKAKWPHALDLPRPGHAQLTYAGVFWLLQWLDGVLPTFTCIYAADIQRPGWRPPAMHGRVLHKKTVSTPECPTQLS